MDTLGGLPVTASRHQWALVTICMYISYVFAIPMKGKSAENIMQAYLSNIFANKGGSTLNSTYKKNMQRFCFVIGGFSLRARGHHYK